MLHGIMRAWFLSVFYVLGSSALANPCSDNLVSRPVANRLLESVILSFGQNVVQVGGDIQSGPRTSYQFQIGNEPTNKLAGVLQSPGSRAQIVGNGIHGSDLFVGFAGLHRGDNVLEITKTDLNGKGGISGINVSVEEEVEAVTFFSPSRNEVLLAASQARACQIFGTERGDGPLARFQTLLGIGGPEGDQRAYGVQKDGRIAVVSAGGKIRHFAIQDDGFARFATRDGVLGDASGEQAGHGRPGPVIWTLYGPKSRIQRTLVLPGADISQARIEKALDTDVGTVAVFDLPKSLESSPNPGPYLIGRVDFATARLSKLLVLLELPYLASAGNRLVIVESNKRQPTHPNRVWVQDSSHPLRQVGVIGSDSGPIKGIALSSDGLRLHFTTEGGVHAADLRPPKR